MTKLQDLSQLVDITQAKYQQQQQVFQTLLAEETRLRAQLDQLAQGLRASHGIEQPKGMRSIGADILWQGWIGRKQAELNFLLAQVLAQKEQHLDRVREAFGKVLVSQEIFAKARAAHRHKAVQAVLEDVVTQSLRK